MEITKDWYFSPLIVLILLFVVLGPFALPLLYKSPYFSRSVKLWLTFVVIVFTLWLVLWSYNASSSILKM